MSMNEVVAGHAGLADVTAADGWKSRLGSSVARLVREALRFPRVDEATGYPVVPFDALARIAGLLACARADDEDGLWRLKGRLGEAASSARAAGLPVARRASRHAEAATESVLSDLCAGGRFRGTREGDEATVREARDVHVPALLRLVGPEEAEFLSAFVEDEAARDVPHALGPAA